MPVLHCRVTQSEGPANRMTLFDTVMSNCCSARHFTQVLKECGLVSVWRWKYVVASCAVPCQRPMEQDIARRHTKRWCDPVELFFAYLHIGAEPPWQIPPLAQSIRKDAALHTSSSLRLNVCCTINEHAMTILIQPHIRALNSHNCSHTPAPSTQPTP